MDTVLNTEDWTKLDTADLGWDGADMWVKDISPPTVGLIIDAERHSNDGRSPWFLLCIEGEMMVCTIPQGDTLSRVLGTEGAP